MTELDALNAVATRLQTLRQANGYATDAGRTVHRLRDIFTGLDQPPYLGVLFEGRDVLDGASRLTGCPHVEIEAEILVVGVVQLAEDEGPDEPLNLLNDIDNCLHSLPGVAALQAVGLTVTPGSSVVLPHEDGDAETQVQHTLLVQFTKTPAEPTAP